MSTIKFNINILLSSLLFMGMVFFGGHTSVHAWSWTSFDSNFMTTSQSHIDDDRTLPRHCPMPLCVEPSEGCRYVDDPTLGDNGCPAYPCGRIVCEEEHSNSEFMRPFVFNMPSFIDIDSLFSQKWTSCSDFGVHW